MVPPPSFATSSRMAAPWGELDADEKRQRVLDVAKDVFTDQGLDATMPRVAAAAGVGVGSLYRCYGSKEDLVAALVIRQLRLLQAEVSVAAEHGDAWTAIERSVRRIAERQATNKLLSAALGLISERRDVVMALGELSLAWQQLIDRAREDGTVRSDATVKDLRFVFAAARAADEVEPGGRDRILTLLLEALRR
ncbi:MAG TPA: TetR family transcriptional regulator [Solirubrobacterales bacterium]|nr:TetR family transcriptional regulator [Solirubrobacterales bacterium]